MKNYTYQDKSAGGNVELSSFSPLSRLTPGTEGLANLELNDIKTESSPGAAKNWLIAASIDSRYDISDSEEDPPTTKIGRSH
jgi:hypothetical protein